MNASEHSAVECCSVGSSCSMCFNTIADNRGFGLLLTPKCATQSIVDSYKASRPPHGMKFMSKEWTEGRMSEDLFIGFTRNPFDRLVSCWKDKCINQYHRTWPVYGIPDNASFEQFVDIITDVPHEEADKHWRAMSYDIITDEGVLIPHHIVRFENIQEDYDAARAMIKGETGAELGELPHKHASGKNNYREYYNDKLIEKVAKYFAADLTNFNYEF